MKLARVAALEVLKQSTKKTAVPFALQFFAEPGDPGAGEPGGEPPSEPKPFDELLKDKAYQSEFDKRVAKALETAKGKWETDYQQKLEDAKSEAAKLAKMNADEKAKYEAEKRNSEYNKRLKDLTTRELKAEAYEQVAEKGLPKELVEILNYESADTVKASMEAVATAFQQAVEKAVNEKLRGPGAPKGGTGGTKEMFEFNFTGVRPKN